MQRLAAQRQAKSVLIGFLMALADLERQTNQQYAVEDMMALFIAALVSGQRVGYGVSNLMIDDSPSIIVGTADHADPDQVRDELALGMGDLFGDED